ncbi:hypothetical protein DFH07DRAFT_800865 [Mycena maculata]|uniref:WKF domain-containing protein n=1 Tax=Mycena maculata TaxID=230809 RepID=A0AAD7K068_9AGAR|nr:hypothetical protein DFH07DRAFT_800865 [Mycena maculata]
MAETLPRSGKQRKEDVSVSEESKKKPKREKRRRENVEEENSLRVTEESAEPEKKKYKKNKTGFPDPQDDPALSEQASKALLYAFYQFRKPSKWKFSKARQNWLIRNFWSDTIPDTYLVLTTQYLSNVKGGVREKLIQDCQSILSPPAPDKPTSSETTPATQSVTVPVEVERNELKLVRARALLDALEKADTAPAVPE